ncbi:Neural-cadherin [Bagarius yarrelli]|uniref:Neural-cadherin n=1 Tax=Bagarius yarrelli TaxID=175774 RepID=A0A556V8R3_BAGYA|nr:Neural-cadherin [Bagarius yarrelli]
MKTRQREAKLLGCIDAGFLAFFLLVSVVATNPIVYHGEVEENAPVGSVVLHFGLKCNESGSVRLGSTLLGENASDFSLSYSAKTGFLLKTAKSLDRELKSRYDLHALLSGCELNSAAVVIEVLDKNDNPPQFSTTTETIKIDEFTAIGSELLRLSAQDKDAGRNGAITFITSPNPNIHVVPKTGQVFLIRSVHAPSNLSVPVYARDNGEPVLHSESLQLHVVVTQARLTSKDSKERRTRAVSEDLSYTVALSEYAEAGDVIFTVPDQKFEKKRFELLSPEAGSPVRVEWESGRVYLLHKITSSIQVVVKILNARGEAWYLCRLSITIPGTSDLQWAMFPEPYLATAEPSAAAGTVVYRLLVRQRDSSLEAAQFVLVDGGEECFEVDRSSGEVRTTGRPLSPGKEYTLTVQAVDTQSRKGPHASVAVLVGLRPPQFFNTSYSIYVPESTEVGHAVAVVQAVSFQKKMLSYILLVNSGNLFSINQESGALSLTHTVDYESGPHLHHLQVRTSEPDTGLSNVAEVVVHITDENDCTPEFIHSIYSRDNIPETTPSGTSLLHGVISPSRKLDYERPNHMYECVVVAVDKGTPSRTGTASIRIRMANVNDEAPVFTQTVYKTFLSEDAGPETLVAIVHAKDPDGDGVTYAITGGNEDSNFELDNQKGIIRLRRSPPPKLRGLQYVLNVTATDDNAAGGPLPLSSSAQVIVGINDVNNNKPVFEECHNYSANALVLENQPPGTVVLRVQAHDADTGVNGEVKYRIMQRDGASPGFIIDADTGVISTAVSFDRERQREYTLSVTATDQAEEPLIGICQITVLIGDQNDNNPKFENSRYQYFLREDTPVGTSFLRAAAHDDDQGTNAAITYSLTPQNPAYIHINPSTGWVYVNHPISQTSRISQQIIATDGGNLSSSVDLTVIITNMHNQPPQWEQGEYWVTIPENTVRDAKIVAIKATSPLGDPRVTYNLEEGQVPETNMPVRFYIKPNRMDSSASILVAEPLDYETTRFFTLRVRVQNVAAVPLASFTTVYVNITVPEGAEIGTSVAQVSASDLDSGLHGMVTYIILKDQSGDSQFFAINPNTGMIHTQATFDREQKSSYLIEVQSQDSSESARPGQQGQPNSDTAYVRIFVTDVNDNAPAFSQPVYEISVEEDKEVGYVVITVTANDEDEGANAKLRYQITSGNTMGTFDVDPEIGTIFIAQRLDYERVQRYHLRLVASDGKWENQTVVVINIINQNDEAPIFSQTEYHTSVTEELIELPVLVLEVSATDPDQEADQSAVRYSLHGQGAGSEFTIEELTGKIYAQKRLDREDRPAWRFLVLATDENGDGLTGFADVLVEVRDINDNAPQFVCATDGCFVGHVPENSPADTSIMEMQATDLDDPKTGKNAVLTYRIVQNVRNEINLNLFSINPATGTIYTVLRSLDREVEDHYLVVVEARDGGGLSGTGTATIIVSDVNDHPPVFTQRIYMATMPEDLDINSEVLAVTATDGDEGENSVMTFSIIGGDDDRKFFIETDKGNRQGVVRLKKKIDFEKPHERTFNLTVKVEDADFYSVAYCVIQVEDSNDHAPVFFPQFYDAGSMFEDVPLGTIVAQVTAMDLDSGQNGKFSYSIAPESDPLQQFLIDKSGWVVVADSLDREKVLQHRLIILATDMGKPSLTGSAIVLVAVHDVNDNGPEFEVPYRPIVWENAIAPQLVQMNDTSSLLYAIDKDSSPNAGPFSIRLLMITSDATNFNLTDLQNGSAMITTLCTFDRERQKEYLLPILMTDSGSPPMSSTSTLTVIIGDINDHPHASGHSEFIVYNYEGSLPTTILGQVSSPDIDDWSEKVYKFEDRPPRHFILNQNSGQLSIKSGTPVGSYRLQVRVSDKTWPDVTSTVQITVKELKEEALLNAGSLRISNVTAEDLFRASEAEETLYERLQRLLSEILQTDLDKVHIISLANGSHSTQQHLSLWFAAHGSPYYKPEKLHGNVAMHKTRLESALGVSILQVGVDECAYADCSPAGGCSSRVTFSDTPSVLNGGNTSLVSVSATVTALCGCLARESKHMSCSSYPHSPCLNGGTCTDTDMGYRCQCPPLFDGPECQQTKRTFLGDGYAWFPPIKPCFKSHMSLEFITESADGLLLYNGPLGVHKPGDKEDFIALELKKGIPVLSVNHGSGTVTLQLPAHTPLSDRRWHHLDIISDGKEVHLIVDYCSGAMVNEVEGLGVDMFETDQSVCKVSAHTPGNERFLNLNQPLQLGGVKGMYPLPHTHYKGFVGCIRNLVVDTQVYDLSSAAESMNSAAGCSLTDGVCMTTGGPSCGLRGKCLGEWGSFSCDCHPGYSGHKCDMALPEWSFEKDSILRYQLRTEISSRRTHTQLLIRTRSSSGFLLSMSSQDSNEFIILEIVDGYVCVRANLGDGPHTLKLGSQRVDHGQWVLVSLSRHDNVFTLQLEQGGGSREVTRVLGNKLEIIVHSSNVLLGNSASHNTQGDFQGCMRDVRLNGHSLPLDGQSSEFVTVLERQGVQAGCHSDACRAKPCQKPLYCVDLWRKHECRCPVGQLLVVDEFTGLVSCAMSPCGPSTCRNGGTCLAHSTKSYQCRCPEGFRGQWCEISQVKTSHLAALSPSSILAISMCLLVFFAVLVAVTVWNQKGSENKFRKRGVYHIPAEHESWEDVRENILNYNEEGGGEQDQNAYDITELKRPFCSSLSQSSSCTTAPLIKSTQGSQEEVHPDGFQPTHQHHHNPSTAAHCAMDFKNYVARIIWEADNDILAFPMDTYRVYCMEGADSNAGSLSSLSSAIPDEDFSYEALRHWGPKFEGLREMYQRREIGYTNPDVVQSHSPSQREGKSFAQLHYLSDSQ